MAKRLHVGDSVRLKSSLKQKVKYDGLTFYPEMDIRPERIVISELYERDKQILAFHSGCSWLYTFEMLDMRTIRRSRLI